jgi:glycosyltransferase involved in cell wall biosynthesis
VFGRVLAERRKSFFCALLDRPEIADAQLIQAHFVGWAAEVGIPLAQLLDVPVVVTAHSPVADTALWQMRYVQERADAVVVVSEAERQGWIEKTGSDRNLVRVWNGAAYGEAHLGRPGPDLPLQLVAVGRLSPEKRVCDLIVAAAHLRDMGCRFELHLFGDGPMRSEIESLLANMDLRGRVRLHGFKPHAEVMERVAASHLLVHAAELETFGLALIEAMGLGLPVVAARSSGAADVVIDGETGFLVPCRAPRELAEQIARLAAAPALRQRLGRAAKARFDREFSLAAHMKNMERVWASALAGGNADRSGASAGTGAPAA